MAKDHSLEYTGDFFDALAGVLGAAAIMSKALGHATREYDKMEREINKSVRDIKVVEGKVKV